MEWIYWIIGTVVCLTVIASIIIPTVYFSKKPPAQLNDVYIGMPEEELLEVLGSPKKIERLDEATKTLFYRQVDRGGLFLWSYYKQFQILVKDGVVTNISYLQP